eukprot:10414568-Heterocapsa_arctica.AAC.1
MLPRRSRSSEPMLAGLDFERVPPLVRLRGPHDPQEVPKCTYHRMPEIRFRRIPSKAIGSSRSC